MITVENQFAAGRSSLSGRYRIEVLTHSGLFHADEVFAIALLYLYYKDMVVYRTRDQTQVEQAVADPRVFVIDAGGVYDPAARCFDHHGTQAGKASVALLFEYVFGHYRQDPLLGRVYNRLIKGLSDWDLGRAQRHDTSRPLYLPQIISGYNRPGDPAQSHQFIKAVELARQILANELNAARLYLKSERIWQSRTMLHERLALLEETCTFWRSVQGSEPAIPYMAMPVEAGWAVMSADSARNPLPRPAAGQPGLRFWHENRFYALFDSRQAAGQYIRHRLLPRLSRQPAAPAA